MSDPDIYIEEPVRPRRWLGWLNFYILQWFLIRLAEDADEVPTAGNVRYRRGDLLDTGNGFKRITRVNSGSVMVHNHWLILWGIYPGTGYGNKFWYIWGKRKTDNRSVDLIRFFLPCLMCLAAVSSFVAGNLYYLTTGITILSVIAFVLMSREQVSLDIKAEHDKEVSDRAVNGN